MPSGVPFWHERSLHTVRHRSALPLPRGVLHRSQFGVDQGTAASVLVAHEVSIGVPGLDGGLVAEERLMHLDGLTAPDLDRGEVVAQVVRCRAGFRSLGCPLEGAVKGAGQEELADIGREQQSALVVAPTYWRNSSVWFTGQVSCHEGPGTFGDIAFTERNFANGTELCNTWAAIPGRPCATVRS